MTLYNPEQMRHQFDTFLLSSIRDSASAEYDDPSIVATALVKNVVGGWLVGLSAELLTVLERSHKWLAQTDHDNVPTPWLRNRTFALATARWMLDDVSDVVIYEKAASDCENYFDTDTGLRFVQRGSPAVVKKVRSETLSHLNIRAGGLADYLIDCIECAHYDRALAYCREVGFAPKTERHAMISSTDFGLWYCAQASENQPIEIGVGEGLLRRHLQGQWLNKGRLLEAAGWLKIILWNSGLRKSPLETILSAYDYMPDVKQPQETDGLA